MTKNSYRYCVAAAAAFIISLLLASCGGGGGGGKAVSANVSASVSAVHVGESFSISWSSANADSCQASGAAGWESTVAASGTQWFSPTEPANLNFTLTCTGKAGSASSSAAVTVNPASAVATGSNVAQIVVDSGPSGNEINMPYVSVTICRPGTDTCQTIDHILVDTGSYGLRIIGPGVISSSLALPSVNAASGNALGECAQFASGFTWGSVNSADVKISGETALSVPIEVIGNTATAFSQIPDDCSSTGSNMGTVATMGAKGILGVGLFKEDCGAVCASRIIPGTYYECNGTTCTGTTAPLSRQVANPVAFFPLNNNGVMLELPSVPTGGASALSGKLIFGIGTQENNQLAGTTIYRADSRGNFKTIYKGKTYNSSFLDSGSNGLFFPDSTIRACTLSTDFYCPSSPLALSAVNAAYDSSTSGTVNFTIESVDNLNSARVAASIGGNTGSFGFSGFDWGFPFFFGRKVFVTMDAANTPVGTGPFWAY